MTLDEVRERVIRELGEDKNRYDEAVAPALRLGHAVFVATPSAPPTSSSRVRRTCSTTSSRRIGARDLLRTLEDKETLIRLLDRTRHAEGIQVFLGAETAMAALGGSSVVAMSYGPEEQPIGALAVIGPMRMNYGKVMSVVDVTADTVVRSCSRELGRLVSWLAPRLAIRGYVRDEMSGEPNAIPSAPAEPDAPESAEASGVIPVEVDADPAPRPSRIAELEAKLAGAREGKEGQLGPLPARGRGSREPAQARRSARSTTRSSRRRARS